MADMIFRGAHKAVAAIRVNSGLSMSELARRSYWDKGLISKYEKGQVGFNLSYLQALCVATNTPQQEAIKMCFEAMAEDDLDFKEKWLWPGEKLTKKSTGNTAKKWSSPSPKTKK